MSARLDWPANVGRVILDEVDSTNAEAARRAGAVGGPVWIMARRQTAGRGRRGRPWSDPDGNFAATYLSQPSKPAAQVALRSFVAGLALHEALTRLTGRSDGFVLKWPNDVLLNGGKLAGILLESLGRAGGGVSYLAIGIGVNLTAAPQLAEQARFAPVDLLSETGIRIASEDLLDFLAPAYAHWEAQLDAYGFAPIRAAWLSRTAPLGTGIVARTMQSEIEGSFAGLDDHGALILKTAQGSQIIPAADVFFRDG